MSMIEKDFSSIINENQWLTEIVNGMSRPDLPAAEIYRLFTNFSVYLPEFERLKFT